MPKLLATQAELTTAAKVWLTLTKGAAPDSVSISAAAISKVSSLPVAYLFIPDDGEGWVILAADKQAFPVLAHSSTGTFEVSSSSDYGPNLFIDQWVTDIDELHNSEAAVVTNGDNNALWTNLLAATLEEPVLQNTPTHQYFLGSKAFRWSQGSPYNVYCPTINGQATYVGCAGIALSMLAAYYNWGVNTIDRGGPEICYYTYNNDSSELLEYGVERRFDINEFELATATDEQAQFIFMVAAYMQSQFGVSGTGANDAYILEACYFGLQTDSHDPPVYTRRQAYADDAAWETALMDWIDDGPQFYGGRSASGVHFFVVDGYNKDVDNSINWFHFVFGWGETGVGWYRIGSITPLPGRTYSVNNICAHNFVWERNHIISSITDGDTNLDFDLTLTLDDDLDEHPSTIHVQVTLIDNADLNHPFENYSQINWGTDHLIYDEDALAHNVGTISIKGLQQGKVYAIRCRYDTDDHWRKTVRFKTKTLAILLP